MNKKTSLNPTQTPLIFQRKNYQWFLISILTVALGFLLMVGNQDIYDFRKTVLAPIVVLAGFGLGFVAILCKHTTPPNKNGK